MKKLAERHPDRLLDLLIERLTFERVSVELYDTILEKVKGRSETQVTTLVGTLEQHRNEEKEHVEWLETQIRSLGGDPQGTTERSELISREAKAIQEVVASEDRLPHLFHSLLTAELIDDAGWKLLLELADVADDDEAREELRKRAQVEEGHVVFVRNVVSAFARQQVLDQAAQHAIAP